MKAFYPYKKANAILSQTGILLLVILWTYTGLSKAFAYAEFRYQLGNQVYPLSLMKNVGFLLIAIELSIALLLLLPKTLIYGLQASLILMSIFTLYTFLVLIHTFPRVPCSCGGVLRAMSWNVHFFFNLGFLFLNAFCLYTQKKGDRETQN